MTQIGVDFGGAKIEAATLDRDGTFPSRLRPTGDEVLTGEAR
jgi:hypothetical protein